MAALLLTVALIYTLGYPLSLTWDLSRYFAFGQLHSLVFAGNALLVLMIMRWMARRPVVPRHFRVAGAMLVVAHFFTVITAVFWVPAYTQEHSILHPGMITYVLILLLGNFSLMATVPWWTWSRLQLLQLIADTLVAMSLIDIGLTVLLPALVPGWVWTPALTAAVFRLETSIGLAFWYVTVYRRFGRFSHPSVRYWAFGIACMLGTDTALLWGTLRMEQGATDLLLGAGMPFWMVHQTMWSLGLAHVLSATPAWRREPFPEPTRTTQARWRLAVQQGLALGALAIVAGLAGSLRASAWFVAALIISQVVSAYERMQERDEITSLNGRYQLAQEQLVSLNSDLVASNTRLREVGEHQALVLEQRQLRAAEVAHDTSNLLQDIKLAQALVRRYFARGEVAQPEEIGAALDAGDQSLKLTGELLSALVAAAQLDAGVLELSLAAHDTTALLQSVVQQQQARAADLGITLTLRLTPQLPPLVCDRPLLTRALLNIISNALKYTSEVRSDSSGRVEVAATNTGDHLIISVRDNGPGISQQQLARLGEPFVRADRLLRTAAGYGLGLAFSRGVVEQHPDGKLSIESALGEGTTVTILLPHVKSEQKSHDFSRALGE